MKNQTPGRKLPPPYRMLAVRSAIARMGIEVRTVRGAGRTGTWLNSPPSEHRELNVTTLSVGRSPRVLSILEVSL